MPRCMTAKTGSKGIGKKKPKNKWRPNPNAPRKKFYAVQSPGTPRIFTSWPECKAYVNGKSRAVFKGFVTEEEARKYIRAEICSMRQTIDENRLRVYVDGSYMPSVSTHAGWAFAVVHNDVELARGSGAIPTPAKSRNIDGELEATIHALEWCKSRCIDRPVVVHDYSGIAEWALGNWKAESAVAREYVAKLRKINVTPSFESVDGHSGDKWNDLVDQLAKDAIGLLGSDHE